MSDDWGPATLAAIAAAFATVILAGFTYWLAHETRRLAQETADNLKAGWRPVLVPAAQFLNLQLRRADELCEVHVPIRNAGQGPAMNIEGVCFSASSLQTLCTEALNLGTLSPSEARVLDAPDMLSRDIARNDTSWLHYYALFTYEDLAGKRYMSRFLYIAWDPNKTEQAKDQDLMLELPITLADTREARADENWFVAPPGAWDIWHDTNKDPAQKEEPAWRQRLAAR